MNSTSYEAFGKISDIQFSLLLNIEAQADLEKIRCLNE